MFCTICDADQQPVHEVTERGIRLQCPTCTAPMFDMTAPPVSSLPEEPTPLAPSSPARPRPAKPAGDALSIVDHMRERLAFCEAEIAKREGFLSEREMLRRMIAAAEETTQPPAPVLKLVG